VAGRLGSEVLACPPLKADVPAADAGYSTCLSGGTGLAAVELLGRNFRFELSLRRAMAALHILIHSPIAA